MKPKHIAVFLSCVAILSPAFGRAKEKPKTGTPEVKTAEVSPPAFWRDPTDITSRNLFYGPGGHAHSPLGPFTFISEDLDGSNPKFSVRDGAGVKWKVKLGPEARPETVATRLVWAVGYYANEDYFVSSLTVRNMPAHLHRGQKMVLPGGLVHDARLKREDEKKTGYWSWREEARSRDIAQEIGGLRVMMALINNWDLKDDNNAIYSDKNRDVYLVSDLGASFGTNRLTPPLTKAKGNLDSYRRSRFIARVTPEYVDFQNPGRPSFLDLVKLPDFVHRVGIEWIGKRVPREDARWMGDILGRLSTHQIEDAFRAAGYTPTQITGFATIVERRIDALREL